MKTLLRFREVVDRIFVAIAGFALLAMMFMAAGNVVMRLFGRPFSGTVELVGFSGIIVIGFALGEAQRRKDNVVVDIVSKRYPNWLATLADSIQLGVTALFFAVIGWEVLAWGLRIRESGELSETLKIAYYPLAFCLTMGLWLLALNLLVDLIVRLAGPVPGEASR